MSGAPVCCYVCLGPLEPGEGGGGGRATSIKGCKAGSAHVSSVHAGCVGTSGSCPLCVGSAVGVLCSNVIKVIAKAAQTPAQPTTSLQHFVLEVKRLASGGDAEVVEGLMKSRVCEAVVHCISASESPQQAVTALQAFEAVARGLGTRKGEGRLGVGEGPYRLCGIITRFQDSEAVLAAGLAAMAAVLDADSRVRDGIRSARFLDTLTNSVRKYCKTSDHPAWVPALQCLRGLLVYSLHEDDDEGCAGGGLMIEMLKQGADETTTMANPEAEDKKAAARLCVALEVVMSLCVDPPSAQVLHAFGASKVVCVIAVKRRYEWDVQLWCLRAVLSLSLQCPAARTFMLAPMATILKRFLALHATRAASSSVDPKDSQVGLALGLQALSSLCVSERSEASVGEGNKAADLVIKEGLAEHIIQALKTYNQVEVVVSAAAKALGTLSFRNPPIAAKLQALGAQEALQQAQPAGGDEVRLALGALAWASEAGAKEKEGQSQAEEEEQQRREDEEDAALEQQQQQEQEERLLGGRGAASPRGNSSQQQMQRRASKAVTPTPLSVGSARVGALAASTGSPVRAQPLSPSSAAPNRGTIVAPNGLGKPSAVKALPSVKGAGGEEGGEGETPLSPGRAAPANRRMSRAQTASNLTVGVPLPGATDRRASVAPAPAQASANRRLSRAASDNSLLASTANLGGRRESRAVNPMPPNALNALSASTGAGNGTAASRRVSMSGNGTSALPTPSAASPPSLSRGNSLGRRDTGMGPPPIQALKALQSGGLGGSNKALPIGASSSRSPVNTARGGGGKAPMLVASARTFSVDEDDDDEDEPPNTARRRRLTKEGTESDLDDVDEGDEDDDDGYYH